MSTKKPDLVTPLDTEPGQCCQHDVAKYKARVRRQDLEIARLQSQLKEEQAVNRRLACAMEQAEDELRRMEQGLTPPGSQPTQDHKLADLLAKWLRHWREDYVLPGEHDLIAKTEEALEDFYGVHPPRDEP